MTDFNLEKSILLKEDERIDWLVKEDLKIIQSPKVFCFGMDAVLLANFPRLPKKEGLILDFCAGNGAVGLLASQKTEAKIMAVEIQERLADMLARSIQLNGLSEQMSILCENLKNTLNYVSASSTDLIYCNPPYFKLNQKNRLNKKESFSLARHEITTNFEEICHLANQLLKPKGHFALVHRPERFFEIIETLKRYNLVPKRIQFVYPKIGSEANLVLIEAIKDAKAGGEKFLAPLVVRDASGNYSAEIQQIYYGKKSRFSDENFQ